MTSKSNEKQAVDSDVMSIIPQMGSKIDEILNIHHTFASTTTSLSKILKELKTFIATQTVLNNKVTDATKSYLQHLHKTDLINIIIKLKSNTDAPLNPTVSITAPKTKVGRRRATTQPSLKQNYRVREKLQRRTLKDRNAQHKNVQKVFRNPHEKAPKKQKATERMATDYNKITKQRAAIRALKQKRKYKNSLKQRIQSGNRQTSKLFHDPHENLGLMSPTSAKRIASYEFPDDDKPKKVKRKKKTSQKKRHLSVNRALTERETHIHQRLQSAAYENSPLQLDGIEELEDEEYLSRLDQMEELEDELLKLNVKRLKKKCNKYCVSAEGSKMDMIARILQRENSIMNSQVFDNFNTDLLYAEYDDDDEKMFQL